MEGPSAQRLINPLRQFALDAGHPGKVFHPGIAHALQSAEMFQQRLALLGPNAGDLFKAGVGAGLAASGAVAGDGETVGFVPDGLDQVQSRAVAGQAAFPPG